MALKEYKIKDGDSLFDIAIASYGDLNNIKDLLTVNNVSLDTVLPVTENVQYNEIFIVKNSGELNLIPAPVNDILNVITYSNQNIFDIVSQSYTTLDCLYKFAKDNNIEGTNDTDIVMKQYIYDRALIADNKMKEHVEKYNIRFATEESTGVGQEGFLLLEDGFYILLENSGKIILE
jgi:hypothetical protein